MILVDTSVWIHHLRQGNRDLESLLEAGEVLVHPFVLGELACGSLRRRQEILGLLNDLPATGVVPHSEVLELVEARRLHGRGIGWVDAHLLAAALLASARLWTLDRRLRAAAARLGIVG